ncbi:MAG: pyridoxal-dependent decarboxylase, exosortase A system-associated [Sphingomonadales bacterium]
MANAEKTHAALPFTADEDGMLLIGGERADDIAARFDAPVFVYDRRLIDQTVARLRACMPSDLRLHYAIKANPFAPLLEHMAGLVDGFDVASAGELERLSQHPQSDLPVSFAGPGKRDSELAAAIDAECCVNLESEGELNRLAQIARQKGRLAKAAIRINPPFELRGSGMRMGGGAKPCGIDDVDVPGLLQSWPKDALDFQGFQIFTGSQSLSAEALSEAHGNALRLALDCACYAPKPAKIFNIGGGLGVPYFPGDKPGDVDAVGASLAAAMDALRDQIAETKVVMELGRFFVAEAGVYLTRIVDKKRSRGTTFLVTEGGLHHQLAVSGNFGQVFRKNYPVALANRFSRAETDLETVNIVGCLCTPLDRLGDDVDLPSAQVGDIVAIFRCGAYGPTASPSGFLSHPACQEILL